MKKLIIVATALVCSAAFAREPWIKPFVKEPVKHDKWPQPFVMQAGTIVPGSYKADLDSSSGSNSSSKGIAKIPGKATPRPTY